MATRTRTRTKTKATPTERGPDPAAAAEVAPPPAPPPAPRAWRRKAVVILGVIGICLAVVATRAVWEGRAALADGDAAAEEGDLPRAIALWRRAARWYVPLAPHVGDAYDRLESIGAEAEERGDVSLALAAWRGVRGSILATRSFFTPHADRLEPANLRIANLMARSEGDAADPGKTEAERASWHHALLARDEAPSVPWVLIALVGMALWIGGGVYFVFRGVTADDRMVGRAAATAGVMIAAGLFVWMLGLYQA